MSDSVHQDIGQDPSNAITTKLNRIMSELDAGVGKLPVEAIREAREHRELIIPRLIENLREAADRARHGSKPEGNAHFFALFLLIEFKVEEALPAIIEAMSLPDELPTDLFGDAVHSAWPISLALFAADRPEIIEGLIADRRLNRYVRWAAAQSYVHLVRDGRLMREDAVRRLGRHLAQATEQEDHDIIGGLVCVLSSLWPIEAEAEIREAFDRNLVDLFLIDREFVEGSIENGESAMYEELANCPPTGIDDTIEELRPWAAFRERPAKRSTSPPTCTPPPWTTPTTLATKVTDERAPREPLASPVEGRRDRVGRNDPCPCGSGKKFKKCCGGPHRGSQE